MNTMTMTPDQMAAEIARLQAANLELMKHNAPKARGLSLKVSTKGAISVYGLGRFPVTLYASQWESLMNKQDEIKAFITTNLESLAKKEAV